MHFNNLTPFGEPLDLVVQQAPIGILTVGLEGGILRANPAFCRLIGYTERQLRRLDYPHISMPEDLATELPLIRQLVEQGWEQQVLQKRYLSCNGTIIWAEVYLSLVEAAAEEPYLLMYVIDLSDRKRAEQEIQRRRDREALLNHISAQLRMRFDVSTVLQVAVERLQSALEADRVIAYRLFTDHSGTCIAEAVNPLYPAMRGQSFPAECIPPPYLDAYRLGRLWAVSDIYAAELAPCHLQMLDQVHVRSMMAMAIVSMDESLEPANRTLWGLLVVHQCLLPRLWSLEEQQLIQAVANQLATALEQTKLLHELQRYTQELEARVQQRTQSLERSLQFEQLIRSLTETIRQDLNGDQLLPAAVMGLGQVLQADCCLHGVFDAAQQTITIREDWFRADGLPPRSLVGQCFPLSVLAPDCRDQILKRQTYVADARPSVRPSLAPQSLAAASPLDLSTAWLLSAAKLVSPIADDQGLLGVLVVAQWQPRQFEPDEISLVEQVVTQCAIALRQAHLYRQEYEQRLSAAHIRSFLEASTDVFVEYDLHLRYRSINAVGSALLGRSIPEIIGKTNRELLGDAAEELEPLLRQVILTGETVYFNHELSTAQGNRVFETVYAPITNPSGAVQRIIGICRDITEMRQQWQLLETQNHQLVETTRFKEEFIATTSHELRTPLTAILGFSNVLLQEFFGKLNVKQKDYIERIHSSGEHLLELINDILDLSRLEADRLELDLEAIFLPDICEGATSLIQERALHQGLDLQVELDPTIEWIVADPRRLKQMLLNLLTNAVKFTHHGSIGLRVYRQAQIAEPQISSGDRAAATSQPGEGRSPSPPPEMLCFQVWDTGIGITEADQSLLFAPFSQIDSSLVRRHEGTGLGLVITRKLAELHGGGIQLHSQPDRGSEFTLFLPLRVPATLIWGAIPRPEP